MWSAGIYTARLFRIDPVTMDVLDTTIQPARRMNGFGFELWIAEWPDVHKVTEASGRPEVFAASGTAADVWVVDGDVWVVKYGTVDLYDVGTGVSLGNWSGAEGYDLLPGDGVLYSAGDTGVITRIDPAANSVLSVSHPATDNSGSYPDMAVGETYLWVANGANSSVLALDPTTLAVVHTVAVGPPPGGDGVHLPGTRAMHSAFGYVWAENSDGTMHRIKESDLSTSVLTGSITVVTPEGIWTYEGHAAMSQPGDLCGRSRLPGRIRRILQRRLFPRRHLDDPSDRGPARSSHLVGQVRPYRHRAVAGFGEASMWNPLDGTIEVLDLPHRVDYENADAGCRFEHCFPEFLGFDDVDNCLWISLPDGFLSCWKVNAEPPEAVVNVWPCRDGRSEKAENSCLPSTPGRIDGIDDVTFVNLGDWALFYIDEEGKHRVCADLDRRFDLSAISFEDGQLKIPAKGGTGMFEIFSVSWETTSVVDAPPSCDVASETEPGGPVPQGESVEFGGTTYGVNGAGTQITLAAVGASIEIAFEEDVIVNRPVVVEADGVLFIYLDGPQGGGIFRVVLAAEPRKAERVATVGRIGDIVIVDGVLYASDLGGARSGSGRLQPDPWMGREPAA